MELYIATRDQVRSPRSIPLVLSQFALLYLAWVALTNTLLQFGLSHFPSARLTIWKYGYVSHIAQPLAALALMAILKPFFPSNFGLKLPEGKTYVWPALWIGSLFGPLMLIVDYWPALLQHHAPAGPYQITTSNVAAWLTMQGVFVGLTEEIPFRGLLTVYLMSRLPWRVKLFGFDVSVAGVIAAEVFALAHATSFGHAPISAAIGQQVYVFVLGVLYAYWLEKSGSLLAPAIGHNAGDFIEWVFCFGLRALWG